MPSQYWKALSIGNTPTDYFIQRGIASFIEIDAALLSLVPQEPCQGLGDLNVAVLSPTASAAAPATSSTAVPLLRVLQHLVLHLYVVEVGRSRTCTIFFHPTSMGVSNVGGVWGSSRWGWTLVLNNSTFISKLDTDHAKGAQDLIKLRKGTT